MPPKHSVAKKRTDQIYNVFNYSLIKLCLRVYLGALFLLVGGYFYD